MAPSHPDNRHLLSGAQTLNKHRDRQIRAVCEALEKAQREPASTRSSTYSQLYEAVQHRDRPPRPRLPDPDRHPSPKPPLMTRADERWTFVGMVMIVVATVLGCSPLTPRPAFWWMAGVVVGVGVLTIGFVIYKVVVNGVLPKRRRARMLDCQRAIWKCEDDLGLPRSSESEWG